MCSSVYLYHMNDPFALNRFYIADDSYPGNFAVYENDLFICTGLTEQQAKDYCHGADLLQMNIQELVF